MDLLGSKKYLKEQKKQAELGKSTRNKKAALKVKAGPK